MRYLIISALLCVQSLVVMGQVKPAQRTPGIAPWHNRVSRLIPMCDTIAGLPADSALAGKLCWQAVAGKLPAYMTFDSKLIEKMSPRQMRDKLLRPDSVEIEDPVTGHLFWMSTSNKINFRGVRYWRILEDWTFDPARGAIQVQLLGIAPVQDIYSENGDFRGPASICWFRWKDVSRIIEQYRASYPRCDIFAACYTTIAGFDIGHLEIPLSGYTWVEMLLDDTAATREVRTEQIGQPMARQFTNMALKGSIKAWETSGTALIPLSAADVKARVTLKPDTTEMVDPVTHDSMLRIVIREPDYESMTHYSMMQEWRPNAANGTITITIKAIAPEQNIYDNWVFKERQPLFWIKYEDALPVLNAFGQQQPNRSPGILLWENFFRNK